MRVLRLLQRLDAVSTWTARLVALLVIPLAGALVYEVIARKFFLRPTIWVADTTYMLYGTGFMLGAAYTLQRRGHIRTDFFYRRWSPRLQGLVDAGLYLFFFFPAIGFFLWASWGFAHVSWVQGEHSITSAWRPPIYPFKAVIPVAALLLLFQGVSELAKSLYAAARNRWP
jgi:TRAP-type mannitol/chloroaromatic compound transport system permease small subunit